MKFLSHQYFMLLAAVSTALCLCTAAPVRETVSSSKQDDLDHSLLRRAFSDNEQYQSNTGHQPQQPAFGRHPSAFHPYRSDQQVNHPHEQYQPWLHQPTYFQPLHQHGEYPYHQQQLHQSYASAQQQYTQVYGDHQNRPNSNNTPQTLAYEDKYGSTYINPQQLDVSRLGFRHGGDQVGGLSFNFNNMSSNLYTIPQQWTPDQMSSTSHLRSRGPQTHSQRATEFLGYHQNTSGSGDPTTRVGQVLQEANDNLRAGAGSSSQLEVRQGEEPPVEYELNGIKGTIAYPHQITRSKYKKLGDMGILPAELQVLYDNRSKNALLANQRRAEGAAIAEGEQAYHHRYGEPHWYNVNGSKSTRHRTQKRLYREGKMTPEQANQFELNQITYGPLRPNLQRYWFPELPSKKPETQREVVKSARSKCEWATSRSEIKEILLNEYQQADLRVPEGGRTFGKQAYKIAVYWAEKRWVEKHAKAAQGHTPAGGH